MTWFRRYWTFIQYSSLKQGNLCNHFLSFYLAQIPLIHLLGPITNFWEKLLVLVRTCKILHKVVFLEIWDVDLFLFCPFFMIFFSFLDLLQLIFLSLPRVDIPYRAHVAPSHVITFQCIVYYVPFTYFSCYFTSHL